VEFTYAAYFEFLDELRRRGYANPMIGPPEALPDPSEAWILLHHDVDLDLDAAVSLAEREHDNGWKASYFVLLTSEFYNPMARPERARLQRIADLGHDIGLHFDPTVHGCTAIGHFREACHAEIEQLRSITPAPIPAVSFHRPASELIAGSAELTAPLPHTYLPFFVEAMEYCSDSTGRWRYGPPDERPAVIEGRALHLLTHAEWWGEVALDPSTRLAQNLAATHRSRRQAAAAEFAVKPAPE
jgi:hypothetical protein